MIPFNIPPYVGPESKYVEMALKSHKLSGNGSFSSKCTILLENMFKVNKVLLTPSCTAALEMAALLIDIKIGDEVIMPSYTFVSTANPFVLRGAKVVFVDIRPDNMNIDETRIEQAITQKTKAIVVVHYAGVACEMEKIMALAGQYSLYVIEDAAQAVMAKYKGDALGTIGDIGCFSFHETKNYTSGGEGGAILINNEKLVWRAEIIQEKGTDRTKFKRGEVDRYTWQDVGSSFLMSELQAAYLLAQLENADVINDNRLKIWDQYYSELMNVENLEIQKNTDLCVHNGHMYYLKLKNKIIRDQMIEYLLNRKIMAVFHYIPLHTSPVGSRICRFDGEDRYTTKESERILRLPIWFGLSEKNVHYITTCIASFCN